MLVTTPQASPGMHSRMDLRLPGPPNHRSGSPVGLTSCLIVLRNPFRPVPVTWAGQGKNKLVNMYQGRREFPETTAVAGNWCEVGNFSSKAQEGPLWVSQPTRGAACVRALSYGLGPLDCPWLRREESGYPRAGLVIAQWGSVPISLTHRAGCTTLHEHTLPFPVLSHQ